MAARLPQRRIAGFTIVELLASVAILIIMVLALARVFGASSMAWRNGNKRIESNNSGRTAIEFMARELSGLLVSPNRPTMTLDSDIDDYLGMKSDMLSFVSLSHQAEWFTNSAVKFRDVQQVRYRVVPMVGLTNRYALVRYVVERYDEGNSLTKFTSYLTDDWVDEFDSQRWEWGSVLAENVRNFEVFITPEGSSTPQSDYDYLTDGPAATIDIYMEVLAEDDAIKASLMPNNATMINAASRRYATRIYVQNRTGYAVP